MSAWRLVTNFAIPPALVLTILLIIPTPRVVKKGVLAVAQKVLFLKIAGSLSLVHVMMLLTGLSLAACSVDTYKLGRAASTEDAFVTPNQRMSLLGRKWRGERNFWIAMLAFLLWAALNSAYRLMLEHMQALDENKRLKEQVAKLKTSVALAPTHAIHAPLPEEPSAPPMPGGSKGDAVGGAGKGAADAGGGEGLKNRGKKA